MNFVARTAHPSRNVIVVDAPLIRVNSDGQRPCERLVGRMYGRFDASCHSGNTRNMAGQRGPRLIEMLSAELPVAIQYDASRTAEVWPVIETYPHPAHIELFSLSRILKYKKGRVDKKKEGLRQYARLLGGLANQAPPLRVESVLFLTDNLEQLRGERLKEREDLLDSLFCAYTAAYLRYHRRDRSRWRVIKAGASPDFITIPLQPAST